jgi:hypothetical protein
MVHGGILKFDLKMLFSQRFDVWILLFAANYLFLSQHTHIVPLIQLQDIQIFVFSMRLNIFFSFALSSVGKTGDLYIYNKFHENLSTICPNFDNNSFQ